MKTLATIPLLALCACACEAQNESVEMEELLQSTTSWDGAALPAWPQGPAQITVRRYTIAPHATLPWHRHPVINAGVLLRGRLRVLTREGKELILEAGTAVVETVDDWHQGTSIGEEAAEILVFYAGTPGTPLAIQEETAGETREK